jgi:hypothetical protein
MRKRSLAIVACLALSCGKLSELPTDPGAGGGGPIDPTATFTRVQNEIFTPTCAALGCHDRLGRQQGLVLAPGLAYGNIVNVASTENAALLKVAPGDFANSYLYRKIIGVGITGDRMPQTGPALNDAQIKLIRDWIRRGAPND